jgi:hypothetical protein
VLLVLAGCGTTKTRSATEQLLMSDAVDRTVARIDFSVLSGQKVYFDTDYIKSVKGLGFVNADYVVSSLRQQMLASGCLLQEKREEADYVVEGRIGALGTDGHEVIYGIPASNGLSTAATLLPNSPPIPAIPEISVAKKEDLLGATKIAVFAYHRESHQPVWQSGVAVATSDSKDVWLFGAGPFQYGSIYHGTRFAGTRLPVFSRNRTEVENPELTASYYKELDFRDPESDEDSEESRDALAEIESIARLPKLFPITEELMAPPRRLPPEARVADRPSSDTAAEPAAEARADSPADQPREQEPAAKPSPAAKKPAAAAPSPDESPPKDSGATVVR